MNTRAKRILTAAALGAAMLVVPAPDVVACGCGALPTGLEAMHPKSISVAFAVRDAIDAGLIAQPDTPGKGGAGVLRLSTLYRSLQEAADASGAGSPAFALLLVDSGITHTTGSPAGSGTPSVVVVTHEGALLAVLEGRITIASAFERGLIVVDGDASPSSELKRRLQKSL